MLQQLCDPAAHLDTARVCAAFASTGHAQILEEYPVSEVLSNSIIVRPRTMKLQSRLISRILGSSCSRCYTAS